MYDSGHSVLGQFNFPALLYGIFNDFERGHREIFRHYVYAERVAVWSAPIGQFKLLWHVTKPQQE